MAVLSIILGVLMVICGFSLMATPLMTFLGAGYYIIIMFFVFGLFGIIRGIAAKRFGVDFVFSILSLILGIIGMVKPGAVLLTDFTLIYFAAGWFIFHGLTTFIVTLGASKEVIGGGRKALGIILGILELLLGIYSIAHPMVLAFTIGFLIGFYFIESGFNLIFVGSLVSSAVTGMAAAGAAYAAAETAKKEETIVDSEAEEVKSE